MENRRLLIGKVLFVAAVVLVLLVFAQFQNKPQITPPTINLQPQSGNQTMELHPLMIESLRNRSYPGGEIKIEQNLGNFTGYQSFIVSYPSDGLKIFALMNVPTGAKPVAGWPVIILNHGYLPPDTYQTTKNYEGFTPYFPRNGYILLKPDFRGHGNSEGQATGGHFSPDYTIDLLNLVASVKRYPDANGAEIGLLGHSMGGGVSFRAIVTSKDIAATVMMAGVVGTIDDLFYNWPRRPPRPNWATASAQAIVAEYGEPKDNPEFWRKVGPTNYVDFISGAISIHHGTNDESVPKEFSDHLNQALEAAGKDVEYFVYDDGDHNFSGVHRGSFLDRVLRFFNKHLKN